MNNCLPVKAKKNFVCAVSRDRMMFMYALRLHACMLSQGTTLKGTLVKTNRRIARKDADFCEDVDWQDHNFGCRTI